MHDTASELYSEFLETYFDGYFYFSPTKRKKRIFIKEYDYSIWIKKKSTDKEESADVLALPPLEGSEEIKEGKG